MSFLLQMRRIVIRPADARKLYQGIKSLALRYTRFIRQNGYEIGTMVFMNLLLRIQWGVRMRNWLIPGHVMMLFHLQKLYHVVEWHGKRMVLMACFKALSLQSRGENENHKNFCQDSRRSSRVSNRMPPKWKSATLSSMKWAIAGRVTSSSKITQSNDDLFWSSVSSFSWKNEEN